MIKLVAFDWNGTLIADTYAVFKSDIETLRAIGRPPLTYSQFLDHFDVPIRNFYLAVGISKKILDEKTILMRNAFHEEYERRVDKLRSRSHAKTVLSFLQKNKIPSIIISNHVKERIFKQTNRLHLTHFFDEILANDNIHSPMVERRKQRILANYIKTKKLKGEEVLIVGDTIEEVEIAKELGTLCAAITHGNVSTKRLKAARPDYLISDLGNLINIINEINTA